MGSVRCSFDGIGQMREPRRWNGNERFTLFLCLDLTEHSPKHSLQRNGNRCHIQKCGSLGVGGGVGSKSGRRDWKSLSRNPLPVRGKEKTVAPVVACAS